MQKQQKNGHVSGAGQLEFVKRKEFAKFNYELFFRTNRTDVFFYKLTVLFFHFMYYEYPIRGYLGFSFLHPIQNEEEICQFVDFNLLTCFHQLRLPFYC